MKLFSLPTILTRIDISSFVTHVDKYTPHEWGTVFNIFPWETVLLFPLPVVLCSNKLIKLSKLCHLTLLLQNLMEIPIQQCHVVTSSPSYWKQLSNAHEVSLYITYLQLSLVFLTFHLALWKILSCFLLHELNMFSFKGLQLTLVKEFSYFAFCAKLHLSIPKRKMKK